jgi:F-type H+-transporting ATPase subunit alpha
MQTKIPLLDIREVGVVKDVRRGIARIYGLPSCVFGQLVQFSGNIRGIVMGFDLKEVMVIILEEEEGVSVGDTATSLTELLTVSVGEKFIGRIVNALGEPADGKEEVRASDRFPIFREAPGVIEREPVVDPLMTGIKIIDLVIPIGKGQRELIIGDRQTGKSSLAVDAIINQRDKDVICIYCWIGGPYTALKKIISTLTEKGALKHTIIVTSSADTSAAEQYIAPYSACALGEYFMQQGRHVLIVFDDLTKHAWIYRQMSLLLERSPGREAYPGDIFYLHSQLLERAGKLKSEKGGGSMTFLPIAETLQGDFTGYIQTNLISITDGQLYVNSALFREGFKPAIDMGLSVSRIGSRVQYPAIKELGEGLRLEFAQYRDMLRMTKMRTKLSQEALAKLKRGEALQAAFTQPGNEPVSAEEQIVLFYAFKRKVLEALDPAAIKRFIAEFFGYLCGKNARLVDLIKNKKALTPEVTSQLDKAIVEFFKSIEEEKQ